MEFKQFIPYLNELEQKRKQLVLTIFGSRIAIFLVVVVTFCLILGIFDIIEHEDPKQKTAVGKAIAYFMAFILFTAVFNKTLTGLLKLANSKLLQNKRLITAITVAVSVASIYLARKIGILWLGNTMDTTMAIKWVATILAIAGLGIAAKVWQSREYKFVVEFKETILPLILNKFDQKLNYDPQGLIKQESFEKAGMFPVFEQIAYFGANLVSGSYGKGQFRFSEIDVKSFERFKNKKGQNRTVMHDLFKGLFYIADFNKAFKGKTVVYPDKMRKNLGSFLGEKINSMPNFTDTQLVKLENLAFEEEFAVYSTDQIEARYILTPAFMERLLNLQQRLKQEIFVSFIDNQMYLFISGERGILDPFLLKPINTPEQFQPIIDVITGLIETGKELNLNTRIWSTE